ncbi:uncharacterized protein LOC135468425 [Liolophura sinensis]|uniref:uncharacterized protein LOC135468425 n=1 Tax=Liolophura sinensis TaxID=3198878 RepID=UPI003158AA94
MMKRKILRFTSRLITFNEGGRYSSGNLFIRFKWTPAHRKNYEALKRWKEENTKLFGPILKSNTIKPLGKKSKRKSVKFEVGEDLDAWFNERYNSVRNPSQRGDDHASTNDEVHLSHRRIGTVVERLNNPVDTCSENSISTDSSIHTTHSVSKAESEQLKDILRCKLSAEDGPYVEELKSCIQQKKLPTLPTVTSILAKTRSQESQFFLDRWKAQMIAELGEEGFQKFQQETLKKGVNLHVCIQQSLAGVSPVQVQTWNRGFWDSIQQELARVSEVQALETRVVHPYLQYSGTFDCVATYRDTICLIDWKTSKKPKPYLSSTFDYPLQVCAYIGAYNADPANTMKIQNGLVVVAYDDGNPAHAHLMTPDQCDYYWRQWLVRLHQYWSSVLYPQPVHSKENQSSLT